MTEKRNELFVTLIICFFNRNLYTMGNMKGIIPIGGRGTRMRPATYTVNKHFIPIANKPLIYYPIETLANAGIKNIAITYNPGQLEYAKKILGNGSRWDLHFTFILQEKPLGLANIVYVCKKYLNGSDFVFHLGDNIFINGIKPLVDYFIKHKPDGLIAMLHHRENTRMGVPYFDKNNKLLKYVEKPKNPPHDYAVPGIYFGNKNFFKAFTGKDKIKASLRGEYEITSPYQYLIDHNFQVDVCEYKGVWLDPGKFGDWIETNQYILDHTLIGNSTIKKDKTSIVEGRVKIGKKVKIINSTIRGPVSIGDNVSIYNSFIGPFTSIYNQCFIDGCFIENSVLMESVKIIGIDKPIDSSIIGPYCDISREQKSKKITFFIGEQSQICL